MTTPRVYVLSKASDRELLEEEYGLDAEELQKLQDHAVAAKATAYCPYSEFRVGATLLTTGGRYVDGANVENAAYPVGTCAERVALGKAVTDPGVIGAGGFQMGLFRAIAVSTDISPPASPCGMCRQFIREFCDLAMPVFMFDKDQKIYVMRLEELLPLSFGPEALPPPKNRTK